MSRDLTQPERRVLAHVVLDPDAWWSHAQAALGQRAEAALAAKLTRWRPAYDAAAARGGYRTRAERETG